MDSRRGVRHDAPVHRRFAVRRLARSTSRGIALTFAVVAALAVVAVPASAATPPDFPARDARYHTYPEMVTEIQATQAAHPDIVQLSSIGTSYQGRTIWVAKVSDNVATDEPEPEVMFDGLHHAREHLSLEQTLAILRWLTEGYGNGQPDHEPRRLP